jgi:hypothetical protein
MTTGLVISLASQRRKLSEHRIIASAQLQMSLGGSWNASQLPPN